MALAINVAATVSSASSSALNASLRSLSIATMPTSWPSTIAGTAT
jgi:hypothetical protein